MRARHLIAAVACCSVLSTGIGFAAAEFSHPDHSRAAGSNDVVKQLKDLNREVAKTNKGIGWNSFTPDVVGLLHDIERHTAGTCDAVGGGSDCTSIYSN